MCSEMLKQESTSGRKKQHSFPSLFRWRYLFITLEQAVNMQETSVIVIVMSNVCKHALQSECSNDRCVEGAAQQAIKKAKNE